ncbi:DUF6327 family protein [Flavobacterium suncheonense]|uniref:Glutaminyl-tRNA synthetase n=1 Tax=Flavobacterium suncheonense GH29-5 = DSM 17707 TaxID=1121899 RepID=A0A0A2M8N8_9FLAO|nr:DUF6327 family protein [Flavobacterium suncheonense]KGO89042.1 hypothetical protein Q764_09615 [Flavobacterium suncheonense GH29-5 = DSM 17707]
MGAKVYSSYKEIDRDLEILKLQKELDYEKLSLSVEKTVDDVTPGSMLQHVLGNVGTLANKYDLLQKIIIPFLIRRFMK